MVWDNVPTGTVINSAVINRSLTTDVLRDRVLGLSRHGSADATTVQMFTGNLLTPAGDFTRRVRQVFLDIDLPRPEDRAVKHQDIVGWSEANRRKILRCLYTLLIYAGQNRPKDQVPRTGMKQWWTLVGYAVEVAAPLLDPPSIFDCVEEDKKLESVDGEAETIATILRLVQQAFGTDKFTARDVAEKIDRGTSFDSRWANGLDPAAVDAEKALGIAFAEALTAASVTQKKLSFTSNVVGKILATRVVDQGQYLDDKRTIAGSLKWEVEHNARRFWLKIDRGRQQPKTDFPEDLSSDGPNFVHLSPRTAQGDKWTKPAQYYDPPAEKSVFPDGVIEPAEPPSHNTEAKKPSHSRRHSGPTKAQIEAMVRRLATANPAWKPSRIARNLGLHVDRVEAALKGWTPPAPPVTDAPSSAASEDPT
jgi:hypothetical protein